MENQIYQLNIRANEGYSADQVVDKRLVISVRDLISQLEELEPDALIVTNDLNNPRGANFGTIVEIEEVEDEDNF